MLEMVKLLKIKMREFFKETAFLYILVSHAL